MKIRTVLWATILLNMTYTLVVSTIKITDGPALLIANTVLLLQFILLYFLHRRQLLLSQHHQVAQADRCRQIQEQVAQLEHQQTEIHQKNESLQEEIGRHKQANQGLQTSQERLRQVLDAARLGAWEWNLSTAEITWSANVEKMFGLKEGEFGNSYEAYLSRIVPDDREKVEKIFLKSLTNRAQGFAVEHRITSADDQVRWLETKGEIYTNKAAGTVHMAGTITDITVRKQAQSALARRATEMTALYETSLEINAESDTSSLLQAIVQRAATLLDTKMGSLSLMQSDNKTLEVVTDHNRSESRIGRTVQRGEGALGQVALTGKPLVIADYRNWPDRLPEATDIGRLLAVPLVQNEQIIGVLAVFDQEAGEFDANQIQLLSLFGTYAAIAIDKARLFENERQLRKIAESLGEVAQIINSTLELDVVLDRFLGELEKVITYDAAVVLLFDKEQANARLVAGRHFVGQEAIMNQPIPLSELVFARKVLGDKRPLLVPDVQKEPEFKPPVQGSSAVRCLIYLPLISHDVLIGLLGVISYTPSCYTIQDGNTVLKFAQQAAIAIENAHLYEQIQQQMIELERSNSELQDFAYVASHDLREPLRKIQTFGDRLQTKYATNLGSQGADYLQRMQNASSRMQTLLEGLLAYSRVTTKAKPIKPVDLNKIVDGVLLDLEMLIEETQAQIIIGNLPTLNADATQMRQLFQNLISNALKFHTFEERPVVHVEIVAEGNKPDNICQIAVSDNGIGFDEKYSQRIFNVFQRLHSHSEYEGTGIGLAICQKIVKRHGGTITAKSKPNQGSSFVISLPQSSVV